MPLAPILKRPPVLSLIPSSGVQLIDLGFTGGRAAGVETNWGFYDKAGEAAPPIRVDLADENAQSSYEVDLKKLVETFGDVWTPIPMLREEQGATSSTGRPTGRASSSRSCRNRTRTASTTASSLPSTRSCCLSGNRRPIWRPPKTTRSGARCSRSARTSAR